MITEACEKVTLRNFISGLLRSYAGRLKELFSQDNMKKSGGWQNEI